MRAAEEERRCAARPGEQQQARCGGRRGRAHHRCEQESLGPVVLVPAQRHVARDADLHPEDRDREEEDDDLLDQRVCGYAGRPLVDCDQPVEEQTPDDDPDLSGRRDRNVTPYVEAVALVGSL